MENKEQFLPIYKEHTHREGSEKFLDYLLSEHSDFSRIPTSTRFHGAHAQGLLERSLNVYDCLKGYLSRPGVEEYYHMDYNEETIAIVALLYDICETNCYKESIRNQEVGGQWVQVPFYEYEDRLPYGHSGESVYIIAGFMRLSGEGAFVIRYHMGFSGSEEVRNVDAASEMYPLTSVLSMADIEATYYLEGKQQVVIEKGREQTKRSCSSCKRIKRHNR